MLLAVVAFGGSSAARAEQAVEPLPKMAGLPDGMASSGAAIDGDWLYVYGGHTGRTHSYSKQQSSARFQRIDLKKGGDWEEFPGVSGLQGLVLLAHEGKLYRIGGMTAKNEARQPDDLHSLASFAQFDPQAKQWTELTPLPEGRSSHAAAVLDGKLYVVGGWSLKGATDEADWKLAHLVLDLAAEKPEWKTPPAVPFDRRAMTATAVDGGLLAKGGISKEVDVFDPPSQQWSKGPEIPGMVMNGSGLAACSSGKSFYISGMDGKLYRLNAAKDGWDVPGKLSQPRILHRLLPDQPNRLLAVAGATMFGNIKTVDLVVLVDLETAP